MFRTYQFLFEISLLVITFCVVAAAVIVTRHRLRPFARSLLIFLILFEIVLAAAHLTLRDSTTIPPFWAWFFNLQYELTLGAIFSAFQLAMVGMIAFANGWLTPKLHWWERAYWVLLALTFIYLSLDEYHAFHETLGGRVPTEFWRIPYAIAGAVLFAVSIGVYLFSRRFPLRLFVMIFMGLMIAAVAGIGIEEFVIQGYVKRDPGFRWMYVFEETFEMVGATIILAGVLSYMQEFVPDVRQPTARRWLLTTGSLTIAWYFFAQLMLPSLQARFFAKPANATYDDGLMTLVAYNVYPKVVQPGDEIVVAAYWRANAPLPEDYRFSLHALMYPVGESVVQSDDLHIGVIPARAWFPGVVMKQKYYLRLPRSVETPASLGIMARVWSGPWPYFRPWQDTTGLPVTDSGQVEQLAFDAVVLDHVTALTRRHVDPPRTTTDYTFPQDRITLTGYELPETTIERPLLPVAFWWQTPRQKQPRADLSQMLHLVPVDGDGLYTFDQSPFGGRFPMSYWTSNMNEKSAWEIALPDDLPPGHYEVYTGIYDWQTGTRREVRNGSDALPDNAIYLGTIDYEPRAELIAETGRSLDNYCYGVANADLIRSTEDDTLIAIRRDTAVAEFVGATGTLEVENLTFSADGSTLYAVEEYKDLGLGQFGTIDLETGLFTPVGESIVPPGNPARSRALGSDSLQDVDGIAVDMTTRRVWAITQDAKNHLFEINPDTGELVRDTFGAGVDYVKVEIGQFKGADFVDVEDFAIHPQTGAFYVIASGSHYESRFARIDFDTLNPEGGTVQAVDPRSFISNLDGEAILDVEGLTFYRDGTLYMTSSNNSNNPQIYDSLWRVDLETGAAEWIDSMENYVRYADFESVACYAGGG